MQEVFVAHKKGQSYILHHGFQKVEDTRQGKFVNARNPARIRFRPIRGKPYHAPGLNSKDGLARGILTLDRAVADCHAAGWTDVTKKQVHDFLKGHEAYGREIVAVGDDGSGNDWIVQQGDTDQDFCLLCEEHIGKRGGTHNHLKSKKHLANLQEVENAERSRILEKAAQLANA